MLKRWKSTWYYIDLREPEMNPRFLKVEYSFFKPRYTILNESLYYTFYREIERCRS